ncbi:MAG: FAD-dependent monooxygenase [Candidatus Tyrphobacter sp.]
MDAPVIIVGAGPVGLSLGIALAHHRVRSTVLERNAQPEPESRALLVVPRTAEILRDWGAFDALRAAGSWRESIDLCAVGIAQRILCLDFACLADVIEPAGALLIPQNETERVLRDLVAHSDLCELRTGCEVTGVEQSPSGVTAVFETGGATQRLAGRFLVGCDGAHSVVRESLGLALQGITYRAKAVLSDELVEGTPWSLPSPRVAFSGGRLGIGIEYAPNRWRVIALLPGDEASGDPLDAAAHAARLAAVFGKGFSSRTIWSSLFSIHRRHAERFVTGAIALAGDSAHLNSPAGGQGMNAGIQDSANLAWKLAYAVWGKSDVHTLLRSYNSERQEQITGGVEKLTDAITRVGVGGAKWFGAAPLRIAGRLLAEPGMQRKACRAMGMLGGRYTKSEIVDPHHPLAGRRIDDLVLEDGSRISEKRAGEAALLVVGNAPKPQFEATVIALPSPPRHWHLHGDAALVIRPDGIVASVVEKPEPARIESAWRRSFALA